MLSESCSGDIIPVSARSSAVSSRRRALRKTLRRTFFLKIWERRDIFQGRVASFNGYVYRMARNAALNAIRQMTNIDWEQYIQIEETLPDESFEKEYYSREKELFIRLVVCRMPEQRRRIFEMSRYAGMDNQAIADELKISKRTVENHLTLALKKLREALAVSRFFSLCTDLIRRVIPKKSVCRCVSNRSGVSYIQRRGPGFSAPPESGRERPLLFPQENLKPKQSKYHHVENPKNHQYLSELSPAPQYA